MPFGLNITLPINAGQFRSDYREFTDTQRYPDSVVNYWLALGTLLLNQPRWGRLYVAGLELYTAHNVVLEGMSRDTAKVGGWPGLSKGVISAESAGAVSVSYDTQPSLVLEAGHWNLTVYGTRFMNLVKMVGAGPVQIGPCGPEAGTVEGSYNSPGPGWSGPPMGPGWLGS